MSKLLSRRAMAPKFLRVPYVDFPAQFAAERDEIMAAVERVFSSGDYILGQEVARFETAFADLCNVKHAVSVANGTDALILGLKALGIGPGDAVITAPNSWVSSVSSMALVGATPVFVDVRDDQNIDPDKLEVAITPRTRAIMPVHLAGRVTDMDPILDIAARHGLSVVEDAAQAAGALYKGRPAGSFGQVGCFSLHPLKNLNAMGDGGILTTNSDALAEKLRLLRNHGLRNRDEVAIWGHNSRLDTVQAAILNFRLKKLKAVTENRRRNAARYREALAEVSEFVTCPPERPYEYAIYHLFVIQCDRRDELQMFLASRGIEAKVHYPIPLHLQECSLYLGYKRGDFPVVERQAERILSLPVHQGLNSEQIEWVSQSIIEFYPL